MTGRRLLLPCADKSLITPETDLSLELFLAFVITSTVLIVIPGPNVSLIVANSLAHGARHGLATVAGTSSAIAVQLALTVVGMASFLAVLADWFEVLRWLGVGYLLWLGLRLWLAQPGPGGAVAPVASGRRAYWTGFLVSATNPKTLVFYAAFLPQFVDAAAPLGSQLVVLSATFLVLATVLDGGYALLAGRVRHALASEHAIRLRNRVSGTLLVGAAVGLALARRG